MIPGSYILCAKDLENGCAEGQLTVVNPVGCDLT